MLPEEGEDDEEDCQPRLEEEDDDDDEDDAVDTEPPAQANSTSSKGSPASLKDMKKLLKAMEERHDKFLDKALDELQGTVAETFGKLDEWLSFLEKRVDGQSTDRDRFPVRPPAPEPPSRPHLHTQNLPPHGPLPQRVHYLGSALAAHADTRNPRPNVPPLSSLPSATVRSSSTAGPGLGPHLRGGAAGAADRDRTEEPVYREAALKVEDVGMFEGKDVKHYIRTLEIISDIYGERCLLLILPRCMKSVAKEWFISIPAEDCHFTRSLEGWAYLLRDGFGEDLRRSKDRAESRVYTPWKESVEEYFYDKAAMQKRAEPTITEIELMREIWKGLAPHASELMVVSWNQFSQREFRDELIQRQDVIEKRKRSRFGRAPFDGDDRSDRRRDDGWRGKDSRPRDRGLGSRWRPRDSRESRDGVDKPAIEDEKHRGRDEYERRGGRDGLARSREEYERRGSRDRLDRRRGRDDKAHPASHNKSYHATADVDGGGSGGADSANKGYHATANVDDDDDLESSSDSSLPPPRSVTYNIGVIDAASSFLRSRTVPHADELQIVDLPTPSSIGEGFSYLNGHPLPIEVWLSPPTDHTPTVVGCGDSGGQCLIRHDVLTSFVPDVVLRPNPLKAPSFGGIGGGIMHPLGFAFIPVYIPDREALLGDTSRGRIVKLFIEFQVVTELDCNFLIGRDATSAYGIDFIESDGIIRIGDVVIPIADHCSRLTRRDFNDSVRVTADVTIPPHQDALIPIAVSSCFPAFHTLLFAPRAFVDLPRELHGRLPSTLLYSTTPVLTFSNMCNSPIRLSKGSVVGSVQLLAANTKMTYFASPGTVAPSAPAPAAPSGSPDREVVRCADPDSVLAEPFGLSADIGVDDRHVEHVRLPLAEWERPAPGCDELVFTVDKGLARPLKDQLVSLLRKYAGCFSFGGRRLGKVDLLPMTISVNDFSKVPSKSPYRESPRTSKLIAESMQTLKDLDIVEKGYGPIASPVVMVLQNGKYRFCVDFRGVNSVTPMDRYPIPRTDSVFAALSGAQYFSTMDANKGYHQFELSPESRWLSAFATEKEGQWQYKRVPFGLQNASAFFQRSIDSLLGRWHWQFVLAYIDDVVVWSSSWSDHLDHLAKVLAAFQRVNLTLDERKCNFGFSSVDLLGLRVSRLGLRTLEMKTAAIRSLPFPSTIKQLRQILGQFSYYRQFIPRFASIAEPLTSTLKAAESDKAALAGLDPKLRARRVGRLPVVSTPERVSALNKLKLLLSSAPVLRYPNFSKPFFLYTDASHVGIGAALQQECDDDGGRQHPILFISRSLSPTEKNYLATELECLGVYWSFTKLSHYLDGSSVTVVTDHHALQWLWSIKQSTNSRLHKWAMLLGPMERKLRIVHRPG